MLETLLHKYLKIPYLLHVRTDQKADKPRETVVLLHGLGQSAIAWNELVKEIPEDMRVISIDLLGFGDSPKPRNITYNISVQARSVARTLLKYGVKQRVIIIGHSMGSLTAIEFAKRYPIAVKQLVLCSPPLYNKVQRKTLLPDNTKILTDLYTYALKNPKLLTDLAPIASKLKLTNQAFTLTEENIKIYMSALRSSIIHQTSYGDIQRLRLPISLIYGVFDPLLIKKNFKTIADKKDTISLHKVRAGHELSKPFYKTIIESIGAR